MVRRSGLAASAFAVAFACSPAAAAGPHEAAYRGDAAAVAAAKVADIDTCSACLLQRSTCQAPPSGALAACAPAFAWTAMGCAALGGREQIVRKLIKRGAQVIFQCGPLSPLVAAVHAQNVPIVEALLEARAQPDGGQGADIDRPLHLALANGCHGCVRALLRHKAEPELCGKADTAWTGTALAVAASVGDVYHARELLRLGADPKGRDCKRAPISTAADNGDMAMLKLLLDAKAPAAGGMHVARSAEVVKLLIARGAPVESLDAAGTTPLRTAVREDRREVIAALLDEGADPNGAEGKGGGVPLCAVKSVEAAKLLVEGGADPRRPCTDNFDLPRFHRSLGSPAVADYLETVDVSPEAIMKRALRALEVREAAEERRKKPAPKPKRKR